MLFRSTEWITEIVMEMVLVMVMMVTKRPPPTPRRRGDDDDGDFSPLRSSRAAGSDPLRRESGAPPPPRPQIIRGKLGRPFSGKTKAYIKTLGEEVPEALFGGSHAAPVPGRVGPPNLGLVAFLSSVFFPLSFFRRKTVVVFFL